MKKFLLTIMTSLSLISTTDVLAADVQQCYRINRETQSNAITQGNVVMLDVTRRHMNRNQIISCIRTIDPQKFQFVQLHLNDDENFAVKSTLLHNERNKNTLSKHDLREIVQFANRKEITIIPDIDVPAHDTALIDDLKRCNSPWLKKNVVMNNSTLDYTNPDTLNMVKQIYSEILPAFSHQQYQYVMLGGDEVPGNGSCATQFSDFINGLSKYINRKGFNAIMWNDCLNPTVLKELNPNITVDYWAKSDANTTAQQIADHGNPVKNANYQNSYYNTVDLNDNWLRNKKATDLANQQGSKMLCLWGSNSPQEKQISNQKVISYIDQVQQDMH